MHSYIIAVWYIAVWYIAVWYIAVWYIAVCYIAVWYIAVWYIAIWYIAVWYIAVWNFTPTFYKRNTEIFCPLSNYKYPHVINDDGYNDNDGDVERELS